MKQNNTIVRAIIERNGKYLLVKRAERVGGSLWQFVGGHTDNQPQKKALMREVKEEVNLVVIGKPKRLVNFMNPITKKNTIFYSTKGYGKIKLQKEEVSKSGWFTLKQMKGLPLTFSTKKMLYSL